MSCISYLCTLCNFGFFEPPINGPSGRPVCPLCLTEGHIRILFDEVTE